MEEGHFSISCIFKNCEDGFQWMFAGVYGPTLKRSGEQLWEELEAIQGLWSDPWLSGGILMLTYFLVSVTGKGG